MSALWHPCTQMYYHEQQPPLHIVRGQGSLLYDDKNTAYLDMISSWWVNLHGHCHPVINEYVKKQLDTLEHTLLAGIVHPTIDKLAQRLVDITPTPLTKAFFADSGSAAIEVALKMSLQYWQQSGHPTKTKFIALEHGYHGETVGSLSVTDIPLFSTQYRAIITEQIRVPSPASLYKPDTMTLQAYEDFCIDAVAETLATNAEQICAMIVEPLVQGAAGMAMYSPSYLVAIARLAKQYQIHLIFDEIAVGFGRTGTMFACEQARDTHDLPICPDFLCLSKGLTGGYLPMSCVMTTDEIYNAFVDARVEKGFLHSHSFTGNPLAAAAALASLQIFDDEQVLQRNQILIKHMQHKLADLCAKSLPVTAPRQTGMIIAFTLDFEQNMGVQLAQYCLSKGVFIRPIGNHVYLIPPYCTTTDQLDIVFAVIIEGIGQLKQDSSSSISIPALA